jgi:Protein of unknown function (DUF3110)
MRVFVLLFNAGTDNEGIHTIEIGDRNIVLMFEDEDDALRYAMLLEAQDFPEPSVEALDREEIEEFCEEAGYHCELIPENFRPETDYDRLLLSPPESNRDAFDWEKDIRRPVVPVDEETSEMSQSELDALRRRLEGLL